MNHIVLILVLHRFERLEFDKAHHQVMDHRRTTFPAIKSIAEKAIKQHVWQIYFLYRLDIQLKFCCHDSSKCFEA